MREIKFRAWENETRVHRRIEYAYLTARRAEVIGNIHENPELINEVQK